MAMWPEIVTAIATSILALGVLVALYQIAADQEQCRREKIIDLMQFWVETVSKDSLIKPVVALVSKLDKETCEVIYRGGEFRVADNHFDTAQEIATQLGIELTRGAADFFIPSAMSHALCSKVSVALNALETVAAAWRTGVADRDLLIEEFFRLFRPRGDGGYLSNYREVLGVYPSIRLVEREMQRRAESPQRQAIANFFRLK